jgi:uncharacterized membrane protein YvbJ
MLACVHCGALVEEDDESCPECGFAGDNGDDEAWDGFNSDAEADADVLASAGMGTDEDYGDFGGDYL